MIHRASFTATTAEFASKRRGLMEEYDTNLYPHVADALKRVGIRSWENPLVEMAVKLFTALVKDETDEWVPEFDSMRDEFERELRDTLQKTTPVPEERFLLQVDRTTRWVSTAVINAATEAAVAADPDENVGLEWVTMEDDKVRASHKDANGQQRPRGEKFDVGGVEMFYPGEPIGDPENWINCRCVVRPALLADGTLTAAGKRNEADDDEMSETIIPRTDKSDEDDIEPTTEDEQSEPGMIPDEFAAVPVSWHGVLAPEGKPSGDGRMFAENAVTWRDLPLTLKAMFIDDEGHKGSVVAGRIDKIWREDGEIRAEGVFDFSQGGYESIRMIAEKMWRGVSVDVDAAELAVEEYEENGTRNLTFSKARVSAATLCTMPAFAEAWVALGPWPTEVAEEEKVTDVREKVEAGVSRETFRPVPPQTKDGPGWITHPDPTEDITNYWVDGRGALKIRWGQGGDFNRCRTQLAKYVQNPDWLAGLCANLHYRALGIWPGEHRAAGKVEPMQADENVEMASVTLVASAGVKERISADFFKNPMLEEKTPLIVDDETGHVYGHVATWDTCHIGKVPCVTPPHSAMDYGFFLHGEVLTDAGPVPVGQITLGTGHASAELGIIGAMAHYDNTGSAVADVYCGEDDLGIWVSGRLRDGVTEKQIHELRAAAPSGDWRGVMVGGSESLEMCGILAVNVPGFPIPRTRVSMSGERQISLVAAGIVEPANPIDPNRAARVAALKATGRSYRVEKLKAKVRAAKEGK